MRKAIFGENIESPWVRKDSRQVYKNPWISVREDSVITPAGKLGIYGVVEARAATGVVAITKEEKVILVGQYRYPLDSYSWEIVEGGADEDEAPRTAIERELQEEAGMFASEWRELGSPVHLSNCFSNEVAYLFLAWNLSPKRQEQDETEVLTLREAPLTDCFKMLREGVFTDAMTVIAFHRLEQMVLEGNCPWR